MELSQGYKQTHIGIIPLDWDVLKFTDCADLKHGFQFREEHFSNDGIKVVKIGTLQYNGKLDFSSATFVDTTSLPKFSNFTLANGDVLMALTGATLGKCSIVDSNEVLLQNYRVGNFFNKPRCIKNYVYLLLESDFIQKKFRKLVNEAAQPNIGKGDFDKFYVPLPPTLSEQTAIATTIADANDFIATLQKLITKKRNIKQGAMQKLLQPKEGWEVKKLGEIFYITAGGDLDVQNFSMIKDEKYSFPIYSNALTNKGLYGYTSEFRQNENTITVTARGQVGVAIPRHHKYCAIGRVIMLNPKTQLDINFITECINNFIKFSNESTGVPQLTAPKISKSEVTIPDVKEQTRIASVLFDMDEEIISLETKLAKYRNIKLAMMQNLLTGKIRLV